MMHAHHVQVWYDYRLHWNASEFGDIYYFRVHSSKIWIPQLLLDNKWDCSQWNSIATACSMGSKPKHHKSCNNRYVGFLCPLCDRLPFYRRHFPQQVAQVAEWKLRRWLVSWQGRTHVAYIIWAFPVAAPRIWNSLPQHVTSALSLAIFRSRLKIHLFRRCFPWLYRSHVVPEKWHVITDTLVVFVTYLLPISSADLVTAQLTSPQSTQIASSVSVYSNNWDLI